MELICISNIFCQAFLELHGITSQYTRVCDFILTNLLINIKPVTTNKIVASIYICVLWLVTVSSINLLSPRLPSVVKVIPL